MHTTLINESIVGDAWITEVMRENPPQYVLGPDGRPNGNLLTGPVRLAFTDSVFEAKPQQKSDPNSALKHGVTVMWPKGADLKVFNEEYFRIAQTDFAAHWVASMNQFVGLDNPIFDAGVKSIKYPSFTPGAMAMNTNSMYPPQVNIIGPAGEMVPCTDPKKVYPGVWAIVAVSGYASGKTQPRRGPRFGLQAILLIGDDKPLGGGAPDAKMLYRGVVVKPTPTAVPAGFGSAPPVHPNIGAGVASIGSVYAGGGHLPTAIPPAFAPPPMPPAGYVPPLAQLPTLPGENDLSRLLGI